MAKRLIFAMLFSVGLSSCSTKDENVKDVGVDLSKKDQAHDQNNVDLNVSDMRDKDGQSRDVIGDVSKDTVQDVEKDLTPDLPVNQSLTLTRTKDATEFSFTDFYYGKNQDGTFRIEMMIKGTGSCPTMNDPSPDATMIITINPIDQTHMNAVLLDFKGLFETVSPNHPSTLIAGEFTFDAFGETLGMQISGVDKHNVSHFSFNGQFYATYCPSLDE